MKHRSSKSEFEKIHRSMVDALLYGIIKGLDFLGDDNRRILDDMGNDMLAYLIKIGKIEFRGSKENLAKALGRFLATNGFGKDAPLEFVGTPLMPSAPRFIDYLRGAPGRKVEGQGHVRESVSGKENGDREIDWELLEMVTYGMTKALDSIGAQGQILINRIGWEMMNYLVDIGEIRRSEDTTKFIESAHGYFMKVGFAKEIEMKREGPDSDVMVITYTHSRYHMNVLSRLRDEGSLLYSCPPCVAATSIMRMTKGVKVQFDVESAPKRGEKITLRHRIYYQGERFTEEQAREVSRLMDSGA